MLRARLFKIIGTVTIAMAALAFTVSGAAAQGPVSVGINVPLTGAYWQQGKDQLKAYQMAARQLNLKGGVLGRRVELIVNDTQTSARVAADNARNMIRQGAVMITGGASSAVAVAQAEVCQNAGVLFMAGLTHANEVTGKDAHRHTFRWYNNAFQSSKAMAATLKNRFGSNASYAYIYADYSWGLSVRDSMQQVLEAAGARTVLNNPVPLGTAKMGFLQSLIAANKSQADVLVLALFGQDMVDCLKLVNELGLKQKMAVVVPLMEIHMANQAGAEIMQEVITSMVWYHGLSDRYAGSRDFVDAFEREFNKMPGNAAAVAYVNLLQWASACERAGSFDAVKTIPALEGHHFTLLTVEEYWRAWDHQGIHPTFVAMGKRPSQVRNSWDLFEIIDSVPGEQISRTREENPVNLEPLQ